MLRRMKQEPLRLPTLQKNHDLFNLLLFLSGHALFFQALMQKYRMDGRYIYLLIGANIIFHRVVLFDSPASFTVELSAEGSKARCSGSIIFLLRMYIVVFTLGISIV